MRMAMIGTGYVGLGSGACFSDFGYVVTCIDKDAAKIPRAAEGKSSRSDGFAVLLVANRDLLN